MSKIRVEETKEIISAPQFDYEIVDMERLKKQNYELYFFKTPIGQQGYKTEVKTQMDTSMYCQGMFLMGRDFLINKIGIMCSTAWGIGRKTEEVQEAARNDYQQIMESGHLELIIRNKKYISDGPLAKFPSFIEDLIGVATEKTMEERQLKIKELTEKLEYKITPLFIEAMAGFQVNISFPRSLHLNYPVKMGPILYGNLHRIIY